MEHLLRYALLALLDRPESSIADIMPLFLDETFRKQIVLTIGDDQVRAFWTKEFPALRYKTSSDGVAPIANKLGAFPSASGSSNSSLRAPNGHCGFGRSWMKEKTLIVNLAKGRIGADLSNLMGGLIVSGMANAAYSRQNIPLQERSRFFLFLDEFHSFTTDAFIDMSAGAAKVRAWSNPQYPIEHTP